MKKNLFLGIMVLIGLFPSCGQQETDGLRNHETKWVTLSASLPASTIKASTRALPELPPGHQLRCILEVWNGAKTVLEQRHEEVYKAGGTGTTFEFSFGVLPGIYHCLFWADYISASESGMSVNIPNAFTHYADRYYTTDGRDGLRGVSIKDENYVVNTDARDAFFGCYLLNKSSEPLGNLTIPSLSRPFAKLLILEKNAAGYACCNKLGLNFEVPDVFDVSTGTTGSTYRVSQTDVVPVGDYDSRKQVLFYDYVFSAANSTLNEIALTFEGKEGEKLNPVTIPANIPLQRNYKINASGNLISGSPIMDVVTVSVDMGNEWNSEDHDISEEEGGVIPPPDLTYKFGKKEDGSYGKGTAGDPYLISSATDLMMLSANTILALGEYYDNKYFEQTADIDLNAVNWQPIGNGIMFMGKYDGKNHSVKYKINAMPANNDYYLGLFGQFNGELKNLNVTSNIVVTVDHIKCLRVGSLIGLGKKEKIRNCVSTCHIIINGTVKEDLQIGGLAGRGGGSYYDNSFSGSININVVAGKQIYTGGVAGFFSLFWNEVLLGNTFPEGMKVMDNCTLTSYTLKIDGDLAQNGKPWPLD